MDEPGTVAKRDTLELEATPARPLIPQPHGGAMAPTFPPGVSGNPKGRPRDEDRLVSLVLKRHPGLPSKAADELARILGDGDHRHWMAALREWLDRTEGPVASQNMHHVSTDRAIVTHAQAGPPPMLPESDPPQPE